MRRKDAEVPALLVADYISIRRSDDRTAAD